MRHPNFLDRLAVKIWPRYLYPGQLVITTGQIQIGIVHRLPLAKPYWKIMAYIKVEQGSLLRFQGLVKNLHLTGVESLHSVFNVVKPILQMDVTESGHHLSAGDAVIVQPTDRRYIYPAPESSIGHPTDPPIYFTAASPP